MTQCCPSAYQSTLELLARFRQYPWYCGCSSSSTLVCLHFGWEPTCTLFSGSFYCCWYKETKGLHFAQGTRLGNFLILVQHWLQQQLLWKQKLLEAYWNFTKATSCPKKLHDSSDIGDNICAQRASTSRNFISGATANSSIRIATHREENGTPTDIETMRTDKGIRSSRHVTRIFGEIPPLWLKALIREERIGHTLY